MQPIEVVSGFDATANEPIALAPVEANDTIVIAPMTAEQAWAGFFEDPFSPTRYSERSSVLMESLTQRLSGQSKTVLEIAAENATGERMRFVTSLFSDAVQHFGLGHFPAGSLPKMALAAGNRVGAIVSAQADTRLANLMRDKIGITLFIQAMLNEDINLIEMLTHRVNGETLVDPFLVDTLDNSVLLVYFRECKIPKLTTLDALSSGLVQARSLKSEEAMTYVNFINKHNRYGRAPIHALGERLAKATSGEEESALLDAFEWMSKRTEINFPDGRDLTAIMDVCKENKPEVLEALYQLGADISWCSQRGWTPLSNAIYANQPLMVNALFRLNRKSVMHSIHEMNAERYGETISVPLLAARQQSWEALLAFLEHCTEGVNTVSDVKDQHSALIYAVKAHELNVIQALIKAGADVNHKNIHGLTPMHYVALNFGDGGDVAEKMLYLMLDAGAAMDIADSAGKTALDILLENSAFNTMGDLYYYVNLNKIAEQHFQKDKALAEQYVSESSYSHTALSGVLTPYSPLMTGAATWKENFKLRSDEGLRKEIKSGYSSLRMVLVNTGLYSVAAYQTLKDDSFPALVELHGKFNAVVPAEWQMSAVMGLSLVAAVGTSIEFGFNKEKTRELKAAARDFGRKIQSSWIRPMAQALRTAVNGEYAAINRCIEIARSVRNTCRKIASACHAFQREFSRSDMAAPRTAKEMLSRVDQHTIKDLAGMSRQEIARLHSEARLKVRDDSSPDI